MHSNEMELSNIIFKAVNIEFYYYSDKQLLPQRELSSNQIRAI
jgi:hypothetical protein